MYYIELTCSLHTKVAEVLSAYLISGLSEIGYESFDEAGTVIKAYIPETGFNKTQLEALLSDIPSEFGKVDCSIDKIEQQNWNAEWEKNFDPVLINNTVLIRASFHKNLPDFPHQILIDPKMSFGTGHHSTTALMIKNMLDLDFTGKDVLDMGCGTGVLAILAHKLGAGKITAIDIDEWAVENAKENFQQNDIDAYTLLQGGAEKISGSFDIVLANINRNILLADMPVYTTSLKPGGKLLLSGIYITDLDTVRAAAEQNNLTFISHLEKNSWVSAVFEKVE